MKLIFIVFSFYISLSHTSTYYVPQDFLTIQDGIDSSGTIDVVDIVLIIDIILNV